MLPFKCYAEICCQYTLTATVIYPLTQYGPFYYWRVATADLYSLHTVSLFLDKSNKTCNKIGCRSSKIKLLVKNCCFCSVWYFHCLHCSLIEANYLNLNNQTMQQLNHVLHQRYMQFQWEWTHWLKKFRFHEWYPLYMGHCWSISKFWTCRASAGIYLLHSRNISPCGKHFQPQWTLCEASSC